jgi:hypothetical protein
MQNNVRQSLLNEGTAEIKPTCLNLPVRSSIIRVLFESLRWFGLGLGLGLGLGVLDSTYLRRIFTHRKFNCRNNSVFKKLRRVYYYGNFIFS